MALADIETGKARRAVVNQERGPVKAAFLAPPETVDRVYGRGRREAIEARTDCLPAIVNPVQLDEFLPLLSDVEVLFSTWGMPSLTERQLDAMPKLRSVFYAAGSVQTFALPLLARGIEVISAWHANAVPVAEFTLAQILLACKGYFRNVREYREHPELGYGAPQGPGVFGETVALLGAGAVGQKLIELLRPFRLHVVVFDPFLSEAEASELGVEKVSLEEAFERGIVVSNHLANKPATSGLIVGELLCCMRPGATLINTGRGKTIRHDQLIHVLRERTDITALLDVTEPEPLTRDSGLFGLPNVLITSHIAGSINDEVNRMADFMIDELDRMLRGEPFRYAVRDIDRIA